MGSIVIGEIPFDPIVTRAMICESTAVEFSNGIVSNEIKKIWMRLQCLLSYLRDENRDFSEEMTAIPVS
jgi:hypothetical protein